MNDPDVNKEGHYPGPAGETNLAVLKGITVGLGILLVIGTALVAVLIAFRDDEPAGFDEDNPLALPMAEGEDVISVSTTDQEIVISIGQGDQVDRIVILDPQTGAQREVLPAVTKR